MTSDRPYQKIYGERGDSDTIRLTDEEREAVDAALGWCDDRDTKTIATLRGLLERTKWPTERPRSPAARRRR